MEGRSASVTPSPARYSRYSLTFIGGVSLPEASRTTSKNFPGKSFIITASILAIPNLNRERMNLPASETHARQSFRFVVRLHLRHELSVAALSLNDGNDARTLPARVPHNQMMGNMAMLQPVAILRLQRQRRNERWWRRPFGEA